MNWHSSSDLLELSKARETSPPIDYLDSVWVIPEDSEDGRQFFRKAPRWFSEHHSCTLLLPSLTRFPRKPLPDPQLLVRPLSAGEH